MKLKTDWQQDIIPDFDVLKWKQENQARIRRETEGMTREQIRERLRLSVEEDICYRAKRAKSTETDTLLNEDT